MPPFSVGRISPGCELQIRDSDTGKILGPHERGEVCVKSQTVFPYYYRNPEVRNVESVEKARGAVAVISVYFLDEGYLESFCGRMVPYRGRWVLRWESFPFPRGSDQGNFQVFQQPRESRSNMLALHFRFSLKFTQIGPQWIPVFPPDFSYWAWGSHFNTSGRCRSLCRWGSRSAWWR